MPTITTKANQKNKIMKPLFKIDDRLLYDGIVGTVDRVNEYSNTISYELTSEEDEELTCTAQENDCELVEDAEEINQESALSDVRFKGKIITQQIEGITDKYFRDGNH